MPKELSVDATIETLTELAYELLPGGNLLHKLIHFNQELKKKRTDSFMEQLREDFERFVSNGGTIEENKILNEHFVDSLESIWKKVVATRSEEKIRYFKNILFRQMVEPDEHHYFLKFLNYVDRLNEIQILMLDNVCRTFNEGPPSQESLAYVETYYKTREDGIYGIEREMGFNINDEAKKLQSYQNRLSACRPENINKEECNFYFLELKNFGFVADIHESKTYLYQKNEKREYKPMWVPTTMGMRFLDFIQEYGS